MVDGVALLNDPASWAMILAALVALAFLVLALKPRDPALDPVVGDVEAPEAPEPPPPPRVTAFEFLTKNGVEKWNEARTRGEFVEANFSDVGDAFQAQAEGSKIWGTPVEFRDPRPRLMLRGIDLAGANLRGCNLRY